MDLAWYAAWKRVAKHVAGAKANDLIHTLLARGAASPRAQTLKITPAEADRLKRELGMVPQALGGIPVVIRHSR